MNSELTIKQEQVTAIKVTATMNTLNPKTNKVEVIGTSFLTANKEYANSKECKIEMRYVLEKHMKVKGLEPLTAVKEAK